VIVARAVYEIKEKRDAAGSDAQNIAKSEPAADRTTTTALPIQRYYPHGRKQGPNLFAYMACMPVRWCFVFFGFEPIDIAGCPTSTSPLPPSFFRTSFVLLLPTVLSRINWSIYVLYAWLRVRRKTRGAIEGEGCTYRLVDSVPVAPMTSTAGLIRVFFLVVVVARKT